MESIVVDAGPLIALFRKRDRHHSRVRAFLATNRARLVSTLPVITEVCHFLNGDGKVTLVWVADLINTLDVMTIDRFRVYRSRRGEPFNLVLA